MRSIISPAAWHAQPWRNGRGITHEVARAGGDDYEWRVSVADVTEPGPFSLFPGYTRWTFWLAGDRLGLGESRWLDEDHPSLELAGDDALAAVLPAGPVRVLNVLARPGTRVTISPSTPVRFAFARSDGPMLSRWSALQLDPPDHVTGDLICVA